MVADTGRARRARAAAMVCTALGMAAMIAAPLAREATAKPGDAPAPATAAPAPANAAPAPSTAAPAPAASAPAQPVGEEPAARARHPEAPGWVEAVAVSGVAGRAFVYPPRETPAPAPRAGKPVTVMLHGMCGHPQSACGPFVDVSTTRGWLVCPQGEDPCGGGTRWRVGGPDDARLVEGSVRGVLRDHEGEVDPAAPRVIAGFSLGGTAAVRIAQASEHGTYVGLVVIASQVHPEAAALEKAGVRRVVLAAGDLDMTSAPLQEDARALSAAGLPTRFVSLGRYGHGYPPDMQERMREPMQWVAGGS